MIRRDRPPPGPIAQLVEEFLEHQRTAGRSPWTVSAYAYPLQGHFVPFAEGQGARQADDLTPRLLDAYANHLRTLRNAYTDRPLAAASVRTYLKAAQQLLSWLKLRKGAQVEPQRVLLPPVRKIHREILSREEIDQIERHARSERDRLIIRLLADYGLRQGEVVSIRLQDLILQDRRPFVKVRGKTGERMIPLVTPGLWKRLKDYEASRPAGVESSRLFLAERRHGGEWRPLGEDGVYRLFEDALLRLKFPRRAWPHLMRHSAITHLLSRGLTPPIVSQIVGVGIGVVMRHYFHSTDAANFEALRRVLGDDS